MIKELAAASLWLSFMAAPSAHAQAGPDEIQKRYSSAYVMCQASTEGQSTMGQIGCIADELTVQNAALNAAYRKSAADLTPAQKAKLTAAERAWIAFRDADCASREDEGWGTLSRVMANLCVLNRTIERTIDLEHYPEDWASPAN